MNNKGIYTAAILTRMAMIAALTAVLTLIPKIPIPLGYAHLGDAAVFLFAMYYGPKEAGFAVAVGSALADLLGGFPIWIVPTLLIKYIMAVIVWKIASRAKRQISHILIAFTIAALWMTFGYTIFGAILYGSLEAGLSSTPGLLLKGIVNIIIALMAYLGLKKTTFLR